MRICDYQGCGQPATNDGIIGMDACDAHVAGLRECLAAAHAAVSGQLAAVRQVAVDHWKSGGDPVRLVASHDVPALTVVEAAPVGVE